MTASLMVLDAKAPDPKEHGNKAVGLWRLRRCGVLVPPTVLVASGHQPGCEDVAWIADQLGHPKEYIVRSSSNSEDSATESLAGVFVSKIVERPELLSGIARVREHAASLAVGRQGRQPIPLLIQPKLTGPGGVYLFDRHSGRDKLTVSALGPSAVTGGTTTPADQLPTTSKEFLAALEACRGVVQRLEGSSDVELILVDGKCIFLQCRPLTRPLPPATTEGMNAYFPTWLPPLCGTLWVEQVRKIPALREVRYEAGFVKWAERDLASPAKQTLSNSELEDAERYYKGVLFPRWDEVIDRVRSNYTALTAEQGYQCVHEAWDSFWSEYFNNPHEPVVTAARAAAPPGMAITPRVRDRLHLFSLAAQEVMRASSNGAAHPDRLLVLPAVRRYLGRYGFYLLEGHDFSQPTLAEQPEALLAQLKQVRQVAPPSVASGDVLLRVAWLAEDDNEYKHKFCALLRKSILRLAAEWMERGMLAAREHIWQLTEGEVKRATAGNRPQLERGGVFHLVQHPASLVAAGTFSAEILSPGRARGIASRSASGRANLILLRPVIETADYPLLMSSAGAVVAFGTEQSHGAIFARDIGKPLYRCPAVALAASEGTLLTLDDSPARVRVGGELTEEG